MKKIVALAQDSNIGLATAIFSGISAYLNEHNLDWQLILLDHAFESRLIELAASNQLDGAIGGFVSDPWIRRLTEQGLSAVNLFHLSNIKSVPTIGMDDRRLGETAARHLIEQGASCLSYLGRGRNYQGSIRTQGMQRNSESTQFFESDPFSPISAIIQRLSSMPTPTGILCSSDRVARELICEAEGAQLKIGKDLLIIGVGDESAESLFAGIQISSFRIPAYAIGYESARILSNQMAGNLGREGQQTLKHGATFIPRASSLPTRSAQLVSHAEQLARENLSDPDFDVNALAMRTGSSRRTLELAMQKDRDESPYQMISRLRLEKAKEILSLGQIAIGEVGQRCGYREAHHFSAWFKQRTGMAPRSYQKSQQSRSSDPKAP